MGYREPRWIQNARAKETARARMLAACSAIYNFRKWGDCSEFPAIREYFADFVCRPCVTASVFRILSFGAQEQITREDYDRMRAAWLQTEEGKAYPYKFDHEWETPTNQLPVPAGTGNGQDSESADSTE